MADTNPALETTQRETIPLLTRIRDELMIANGKGDLVQEMREIQEVNAQIAANNEKYDAMRRQAEAELQEEIEAGNLKAVESDSTLGKMLNFLRLGYQDEAAGNKIVMRSNTLLGKLVGLSEWTKENTERMQKAMKSLMIDKPSAMMKGLADKTGKFATDILKLLLTGGILFGLYKLLEWLSKQNPMELYNMAVEAFDNFNEEYGGFVRGIKALAASVAIWKGAAFLAGAGKGSLWLLWNSIKTIFGAGGKFATLAAAAVGWTGSALFGEEGALRKTWRAVKKIFGAAGLFFDLLQIVGKWSTSVIFDLAKAPIVLVWNGIKAVFGINGTIGQLLTQVVDKFKDFTGFGPDGAFQKMWKGITTFFGAEGKVAKVVTDVVDKFKDFTGFGPDGAFQKMWKGITGFFGMGGKIHTSPGFLLTAEEMVDLKKIGLDEAGPFKTLFKNIKAFFGPEGKIAKGFGLIADAEDFVGDQSDVAKLFKFMKNIFGAEGKIATGFGKIKNLIPDFTGEKGIVTKVFNFIDGIFGESSKFSTLSTALSGWFEKFKTFFNFSDDAAKGGAISKLFGFIGGIADTIGGTVKAIADSAVFKGIKKVFGVAVNVASKAAVWIGKIFAPIGWIMGFVEAVFGFWDGFKQKGEGDSRSLGDKLMDGLAGAIDGLVQFLFIDTLVLFQDILNFAVRKLNDLLSPEPGSLLAKAFDFLGLNFTPIEEFTFGDDASNATKSFINRTIGSGKLDDEGNLKEEFRLTPEQMKKLEDKGFDELEERVPAGTQSGAQVNVASQVTSNNTESKNFQKPQQRGKLAEQAGDSSP